MINSEEARTSSRNFKYPALLESETVDELRKLAKAAEIRLRPQMKRQELVSFLADNIPDALPELRKRLGDTELLLCEIVASAGGCLPTAEAKLRGVVEMKRRRAKDPNQQAAKEAVRRPVTSDGNNDGQKNDRDVELFAESQIYGITEHVWGGRTAADLFLFHRALYPDADERFYGKEACLLIPEEARKYFAGHAPESKLAERDPSEFEALRAPTFPNIVFALLDSISSAASKKKLNRPSPGLGRMPKNLVLPVLQRCIASTEVFQKVPYANFFEWYEANEIISEYAHFTELVQYDEKNGLKVSTDPAGLDPLASGTKLCSAFLDWWASADNRTSVIRPRLFGLEGGVRESERAARRVILGMIRKEMKPGRWYSAESIIDRIRKDETGYHFDHFGIGKRGPGGTMVDACEEICKTMIAWPLLLFGIIETNGPEVEYVRLGRWGATTSEWAGEGGAAGALSDRQAQERRRDA